MFFAELSDAFPEPLELAARIAAVDPNRDRAGVVDREFTVAANWYFNGHRNKLTLDLSHLDRRLANEKDSSERIRLQWDVSF